MGTGFSRTFYFNTKLYNKKIWFDIFLRSMQNDEYGVDLKKKLFLNRLTDLLTGEQS